MPKTIALISPGHLGTNPRLVKEADALYEAGYQVHVISCDYFPDARKWDQEIRSERNWKWSYIPWKPTRLRYAYRRIKQICARQLFSSGLQTIPISSIAHHSILPLLKQTASAIPADLYIGHCLAALPAVIAAARKNRSAAGFDVEDLHSGEAPNLGRGRLDNSIAKILEGNFLAHCDYVTASSPLIAETLRERYGVSATPVLNVFPLSMAGEPLPPPSTPSLYWFSQTIGPGRGLEAMIEILRRLNRIVRLDLRGHVAGAYDEHLKRLVKGTAVQLRFLQTDTPSTMARHAASYTAGLALETDCSVSRGLALTNKIFTYLLAGVPVILSRTRAQEHFSVELGKACLLIDLKNPPEASRSLDDWLRDADNQSRARVESFRLGRDRFNWDCEKRIFLAQVDKTLRRCLRSSQVGS